MQRATDLRPHLQIFSALSFIIQFLIICIIFHSLQLYYFKKLRFRLFFSFAFSPQLYHHVSSHSRVHRLANNAIDWDNIFSSKMQFIEDHCTDCTPPSLIAALQFMWFHQHGSTITDRMNGMESMLQWQFRPIPFHRVLSSTFDHPFRNDDCSFHPYVIILSIDGSIVCPLTEEKWEEVRIKLQQSGNVY